MRIYSTWNVYVTFTHQAGRALLSIQEATIQLSKGIVHNIYLQQSSAARDGDRIEENRKKQNMKNQNTKIRSVKIQNNENREKLTIDTEEIFACGFI